MRLIRLRLVQMFDYLIEPGTYDYPPTVNADEVAADELVEYWENPQEFMAVEKENAQVFVVPADTVVYWATVENIGNPKKWCKQYREGLVKLTIPAIIVTDGEDDEEDDD